MRHAILGPPTRCTCRMRGRESVRREDKLEQIIAFNFLLHCTMLWEDLPASSRPKGAHVRDGVGNTTTSANIASRTLVRDALAPVGRGIRILAICKDQKRLTNACASRPLSQALVGGVWGDGRLAGRSSKVTSRCFVNREGRGQGARGRPEGCHRRRRARGSTIKLAVRTINSGVPIPPRML